MNITLKFGEYNHVMWMDTTYHGVVSEVRESTKKDRWKLAKWFWKNKSFFWFFSPFKMIKNCWNLYFQPDDFIMPSGSSMFCSYAMMRAVRLWLEIGCTNITVIWNENINKKQTWKEFIEEWDKGRDPPIWYREWRTNENFWKSFEVQALEWIWDYPNWKSKPKGNNNE